MPLGSDKTIIISSYSFGHLPASISYCVSKVSISSTICENIEPKVEYELHILAL